MGSWGGFPHSKLFINVREKASLAYYVGSSVEGTKGLLTISAGIDWDERDEAQTIIKQQVEQVQQGQISRQELEQTKAGLVNAMISMGDHPSGMIDRNLIGIIHGEMRSIDHVVDAIRAVQLEDVVEVMGGILCLTPPTSWGGRREAGESNGTN